MSNWKPFPYGDRAYRYSGDALRRAWPRLHRGDREPYPSRQAVEVRISRNPALVADPTDPERTAERLQDAWRAFHAGDFAAAVQGGIALGPIGCVVAARATLVHTVYLEQDERRQLAILNDVARHCAALLEKTEDWPNAWYVQALALGRCAQLVSVVKALATGLGNKVRSSLENVLALDPGHVDAHIALGVFESEVVANLGSVAAAITFRARRDSAMAHFETARRLAPDSAVAHLECARAMQRMFGQDRSHEAFSLYEQAAACHPVDARERMDVERARLHLEAEV
ncbi:MAG: hypothetical protein KDH20_18410 [Rhodocyclaceae bacterium]|nr:hypothetical protein [Rhodocyclaceae bacterium]